jgi:hypothetical protein
VRVRKEERTILVRLHDDYDTSRRKYPSPHILDGEDANRIVQSIAAITSFSGARRLPKMIVADHRRRLIDASGSASYIRHQ